MGGCNRAEASLVAKSRLEAVAMERDGAVCSMERFVDGAVKRDC